MNIALALLFCAALVEAAARLPLQKPLHDYLAVSRRAVATLRSRRISEHWKERILPAYARRMLRASVGVGLLLALILAIAAGLIILLNAVSGSFGAFVLSPFGAVLCAGVSMVFWMARARLAHE